MQNIDPTRATQELTQVPGRDSPVRLLSDEATVTLLHPGLSDILRCGGN
jgi:hypothetical protein